MNWMVRFSRNGITYNDFRWAEVGEWTEAPDWNNKPVCGGGLHGQGVYNGKDGFGYSQSGTRFEFCEIKNAVVVEDNKIKAQKAKILAVNKEAWELLLKTTQGKFKGSLNLDNYPHKLPAGFTHCGGYLYLDNYPHKLPAGLKKGIKKLK